MNMSLMLENETIQIKLKGKLKKSQSIVDGERRGLCLAIGIDVSSISFLGGTSDDAFVEELINYLFTQKKTESLCKLCNKLEKELGEDKDFKFIKNQLNCYSSINLEERLALLKTVRECRVEPFLKENELINKELISLGLQNQPPNDKMINIFDQMDDKRTLLILGEPGSGKTTILAELTDELIGRADKNKNYQIPIILNLSSWKEKDRIDEWSVKRLKDFYQVPKEKGWNLVYNQELLLLIDGFDELKSESQKSCVNALNDFINKYNSTKVVICSRTDDKGKENEEKEKVLQNLISQIAVRLKSIEEEQAIQYLKVNYVPDWLITSINNNNILQNLIKVPLFLYLIIEVYKKPDNKEINCVQEDSEAEIWDWNRILDKYIEKQLKQWENISINLIKNDKEKQEKQEKKIKKYLIWLANQMHKENQTEFLIEKMQPKWLSQPTDEVTIQEKIYHIGVRLIVGLLCGLASGLFSEILNYNPDFQIPWINYIFFGLISGLLSGLISGLIFLLLPEDLESNLISKLRSVPISLLSGLASFLFAKTLS